MMEILPILVLAAIAYGIWKYLNLDSAPSQKSRNIYTPEDTWKADRERAQQTLSDALGRCIKEHGHAVDALLWLAGSDGTVSKQEARNMFRFCENQGTSIDKEVYESLEHLNNGMSFKLEKSTPEVMDGVAELAKKEIRYRVAFIGAANAICGGSKRISQTKQKFLDRIADLVGTDA